MYKESKPPKKGGGKKKGAAESDYLSEAGDVAAETAQKNEGAPPRKKGSAKEKDPNDYGISPLSGKPYAKSVSDEQKAKDKAKADAMKKGGAKKDVMMDENMSGGGRKKGAAQYKEEGAADFKGGLHAKNTKHSESGEHLGAKRMGFTQNFGAARQNSYAQGAAKVASIMSFGASKKKGAADHVVGHPVPVTNLDAPDLPPTPRKNTTKNKYKQLIEQQNSYDTNTRTAMRNLAEIDSFKLATSNQGKMAKTLYGNNFNAQTTGLGNDDVFENRTNHVSVDKKYLKDNSLVKPRLKNMELLKEKAKSIQGPRPSSI